MTDEQDKIERLTLACELLAQRLQASNIEVINLQVDLTRERQKNAALLAAQPAKEAA